MTLIKKHLCTIMFTHKTPDDSFIERTKVQQFLYYPQIIPTKKVATPLGIATLNEGLTFYIQSKIFDLSSSVIFKLISMPCSIRRISASSITPPPFSR